MYEECPVNKIFSWIEEHRKTVLIVIYGITIIFLVLATSLKLNTDLNTLVPADPEVEALQKEVLGDSSKEYPNNFYMLLEGPRIYDAETLTAIDKVVTQIKQIEQIGPELSPFSFVTVIKKGTRLATMPIKTHTGDGPWSDEEAAQFKERLLADDMVKGLLYNQSGQGLLFYFSLKNLGTQQKAIDDQLFSIAHQLDPYCEVHALGSGMFNDKLTVYLTHDLCLLLGLCLLVILLVYYFSFRAKRAVLIPFSLSFIGIIWTLGTMTLLGYELTIVSIITPCMTLILGSSYSIHVISEYYNNYRDVKGVFSQKQVLLSSMNNITTTISTACLTTIIGFVSLLACQIVSFKELGISVGLGIFYCAVLSLTYIPAWLGNMVPPQKTQLKVVSKGTLSKIVSSISSFIVRKWWVSLVLFLLILSGFAFTHDKIDIQTNYMTYFPQKDPLLQDAVLFAREMGGTDPHYITLTAPEGEKNYFFRPEVIKSIYAYEEAIKEQDLDVMHILSFSQYTVFLNKVYSGKEEVPDKAGLILTLSKYLKLIANQMGSNTISMLVNDEGTEMTISVRYWDSKQQNMQSIESAENLRKVMGKNRGLLPQDITIRDWGTTVTGLHLISTIMHDQKVSTILSLVLVFAVVCLQFKSFKFGLYSIIPILVGIMGSYCLMFVFGIPFDVVTAIFGSITIGTGIDDAIHFIVRFLNQRKHHPAQPFRVQVEHTLMITGRPILLTSTSIILGMLVLTLASYTPIRYFGFLMAIALFTTTLSTLFILPSVMVGFHLLGNRFHKKTT